MSLPLTGLNGLDDIPTSWRRLLKAIQVPCPTAVLAGGALRDRDNGREVKDLDIFINARDMTEADRLVGSLIGAGFDIVWEPSDVTAYPEDQNLEVVVVAELRTAIVNYDVQLIFTNWDTAKIAERFDYGICRLSFDGTSIVRPPEYDEDREAKVFRLRRDRPTPISMRGSIHRYARLTASKYAGWTWWPYEAPQGECDASFIPL
jgi:hypothetical protein